MSHNKQTEELLLDNMPVDLISPYAYSEDKWVPVSGGVTEGDIKTDVENAATAASILATLIAVVGGAGMVGLITEKTWSALSGMDRPAMAEEFEKMEG